MLTYFIWSGFICAKIGQLSVWCANTSVVRKHVGAQTRRWCLRHHEGATSASQPPSQLNIFSKEFFRRNFSKGFFFEKTKICKLRNSKEFSSKKKGMFWRALRARQPHFTLHPSPIFCKPCKPQKKSQWFMVLMLPSSRRLTKAQIAL